MKKIKSLLIALVVMGVFFAGAIYVPPIFLQGNNKDKTYHTLNDKGKNDSLSNSNSNNGDNSINSLYGSGNSLLSAIQNSKTKGKDYFEFKTKVSSPTYLGNDTFKFKDSNLVAVDKFTLKTFKLNSNIVNLNTIPFKFFSFRNQNGEYLSAFNNDNQYDKDENYAIQGDKFGNFYQINNVKWEYSKNLNYPKTLLDAQNYAVMNYIRHSGNVADFLNRKANEGVDSGQLNQMAGAIRSNSLPWLSLAPILSKVEQSRTNDQVKTKTYYEHVTPNTLSTTESLINFGVISSSCSYRTTSSYDYCSNAKSNLSGKFLDVYGEPNWYWSSGLYARSNHHENWNRGLVGNINQIRAFISSPIHAELLFSSTYNYIGFGFSIDKDTTIKDTHIKACGQLTTHSLNQVNQSYNGGSLNSSVDCSGGQTPRKIILPNAANGIIMLP